MHVIRCQNFSIFWSLNTCPPFTSILTILSDRRVTTCHLFDSRGISGDISAQRRTSVPPCALGDVMHLQQMCLQPPPEVGWIIWHWSASWLHLNRDLMCVFFYPNKSSANSWWNGGVCHVRVESFNRWSQELCTHIYLYPTHRIWNCIIKGVSDIRLIAPKITTVCSSMLVAHLEIEAGKIFMGSLHCCLNTLLARTGSFNTEHGQERAVLFDDE